MTDVRLLGDRYRLVERLGGGGMSVVWRAYDEVLGRQVAVKMLAIADMSDASRQWIHKEAQAAAQLTHPHITSVHDYGESSTPSGERVPYVVMELVQGQTLQERLESGPLPPRTAMLIGAQVAAGLAAAHARGVVHRDVKPGNVMVSPAGAKLTDFGIAAVAGEFGGPLNGKVWGTPAYLAPERIGGGDVVPATDVYAHGLLLYRALTGTLPWSVETISQLIRAHRYIEPEPLPPLPDVPDDVAALCHRCLSKRPEDRPTAAEVARVLAEASGWHVAAEAGSGDLVVGALAGGDASRSAPADLEAETQMVPRGAVVAAPSVPSPGNGAVAVGRASPPDPAPDRRRRRVATAVASALVLLAVVLVAGLCTDGRALRRPTDSPPGAAGPTASASQSADGGASTAPGADGAGSPSPPAGGDAGTDPAPGGPEAGAAGAGADPAGAGNPTRGAGPAAGGNPGTGGNAGTGSNAGTGGNAGNGSNAGTGSNPGAGSNAGTGGDAGTGAAPNPPPTERTVPTPGGSATCRCDGPTATLTGWDPLPGFTATEINRGPAPTVGLVFRAVAVEVRVTFRCVNGVPQASIG